MATKIPPKVPLSRRKASANADTTRQTAAPKTVARKSDVRKAVRDILATDTYVNERLTDTITTHKDSIMTTLGVTEAMSKTHAFVERLDGDTTRLEAKLRELERLAAPIQIEVTNNGTTKHVTGLMHKDAPRIIKQIAIGNPIWLVGPTQSGKSYFCEAAAEALGIPFTYHAFGPTQTEAKLSGYPNAEGVYVPSELYLAVKYGWLFLGDEADTANATVLIWANNGISNGRWAFPRSLKGSAEASAYLDLADRVEEGGDAPAADELRDVVEHGGQVKTHPDCRIVFAANTVGGGSTVYHGRNRSDPSTRTRFDVVRLEYDEVLERKLALGKYPSTHCESWVNFVQAFRLACTKVPKCDVIVSPSNTLRGAKNLAGGLPFTYVVETSLLNSIDDQAMIDRIIAELPPAMKTWLRNIQANLATGVSSEETSDELASEARHG